MSRVYKIIGRGLAGWHADAGGMSSSGGTLAGYLSEAADGALVYDAQDADIDAFSRLVISGPICSADLEPDQVDRFTARDRETAARMLPGLGGAFQTFALLAQSEKFSGLDRVGVGVYEALLRKVPGIKIGRVRNGAVEWEG